MKHWKCLSLRADKFGSFKDYLNIFDILEIRLDKGFKASIAQCTGEQISSARRYGKDVIAVCRRAGNGGDYQDSEEERISLLKWAVGQGANIVDIEIESDTDFQSLTDLQGIRVIRSYHNVKSLPDNAESLAREILRTDCWLYKFVCKVNKYEDNLKLLELNRFFIDKGRLSTCFGMGDKSLYSRVFLKAFGGVLSYLSIKGDETAEGQITTADLDLLNLDSIDEKTECYGILGYPLRHSRSCIFHNKAMRMYKLNAVFLDFPVQDPVDFINFITPALVKGLAVTYPYKSYRWFEKFAKGDLIVQAYGNGNTIYLSNDGYKMTDTDREGFAEFFKNDISLETGKALIIGSGNTSIKIADYLLGGGWEVSIASRSPNDKRAGYKFPELLTSYSELLKADFDLLINATPVNAYTPEDWRALFNHTIRKDITVLDLNYGEAAGPFLKCGLFDNCRVYDGRYMFLNQAALQFEIWTGIKISSSNLVKIKKVVFPDF